MNHQNVSRRTFFHTTASATAATLLAGRAQAQAVAPNDKIRVGLIGSGGMGVGNLRAFLTNPEVDCPVICDVDEAKIANGVNLVEGVREMTPDTTTDYRRVLDRNDLDALIVATPDHWHALPMIHGCQAGLDVYVEKPLGRTIDEGRAMLEATRRHNRVVQMGTQWRSSAHYGDAVKFIQSGKLGPVRMVRAWAYLDWVGGIGSPADQDPPAGVDYDMWLGPAPLRPFNENRFHFNFRWFWDYAGGLMTDWGVHLLNVCLWAQGLETPTRVSSFGGKHVIQDNTETPDTQVAVYQFPSYTLIWEHQMLGGIGPNGKPHGMYFSGEEGAVLIDQDGWEVIPEPKRDTLEAEKHDPGPDARVAHIRNFLDCMATREDPVQNLETSHHVSTVAHLGNLALRAGTELHWDAEAERVTNDADADALVGASYRSPWELPYSRRT